MHRKQDTFWCLFILLCRLNRKTENEAHHVIRLAEQYKDKLAFPIFYGLEHEDKEKNINLEEYVVQNGKKFIEIL